MQVPQYIHSAQYSRKRKYRWFHLQNSPAKILTPFGLFVQRNLTEYYNAVDTHNMMVIFASMLHERRIIMISSRVSRLSACIQAANAVIYPMIWQHIYIPVLPPHLIDYLLAPMPYLAGVPSSTWQVDCLYIYIFIYGCLLIINSSVWKSW